MTTKQASLLRKSISSTGIRIIDISHEMGWVVVWLPGMDCMELIKLGEWIKNTFKQEGLFSHLLPKVGIRDGKFCLVLGEKDINRVF